MLLPVRVENRVEQSRHAALFNDGRWQPVLLNPACLIDMANEMVGGQGDPVRRAPGQPSLAGGEVGHISFRRRNGIGDQRSTGAEEGRRHLGVCSAQKDEPAGRNTGCRVKGFRKARREVRAEQHVVLEHQDAAVPVLAGEAPGMHVLQHQRHVRPRKACRLEAAGDESVIQIVGSEIEYEAELDPPRRQFAGDVRYAILVGGQREHIDGIDGNAARATAGLDSLLGLRKQRRIAPEPSIRAAAMLQNGQ